MKIFVFPFIETWKTTAFGGGHVMKAMP